MIGGLNTLLPPPEPDAFAEQIAPDRRGVIQTHLLEAQRAREGNTSREVPIAVEKVHGPERQSQEDRVVSTVSAAIPSNPLEVPIID